MRKRKYLEAKRDSRGITEGELRFDVIKHSLRVGEQVSLTVGLKPPGLDIGSRL